MIQLEDLNHSSLLTTIDQNEGFVVNLEYSLRESLGAGPHEFIFDKVFTIELVHSIFESKICLLIEKLQFGFTFENTDKKYSAWKAFCNGKIATIIIYERSVNLKQIC
jgi:hypothetical protein